jgi:hypothetical protein
MQTSCAGNGALFGVYAVCVLLSTNPMMKMRGNRR